MIRIIHVHVAYSVAYLLRLQLILKARLLLMQRAESVDLLLVLSAHLHIAACRGFILLGELRKVNTMLHKRQISGAQTIRRCIALEQIGNENGCDHFKVQNDFGC